jgi:peroxiredoxin Q/BCP
VDSHAKWKEKMKIPHQLLADEGGSVAQKYGVWVEKTSPSGKTYWGVARTTFLIDEQGNVFKVFPKVQVKGHSGEVLTALKNAGHR